jgi:hypothetical protein
MSTRTAFLSKLIGLYCLIVALSMLVHREATVVAVNLLVHNPAALLLGGFIALMVGLAIVLGHDVWFGGLPALLVTLFGWAALIKGVILLFLPPRGADKYFAALHFEQRFYQYAVVMAVLGAYLTYAGFNSAANRLGSRAPGNGTRELERRHR